MSAAIRPPIVIFGAGKIARGYIGHLIALTGLPMCFVDVNPDLVNLINERGRYTVHIQGNAAKSGPVTSIQALLSSDPEVDTLIARAPLVFVSVGGNNLRAVATRLAGGLRVRRAGSAAPLNIILCENWYQPAKLVRDTLEQLLTEPDLTYLRSQVGIVEATVLRSGIDPTPAQHAADPLAVQAQDYWQLQIDADALVPGLPEIVGLTPIEGFQAALVRKLYTYNATNATISYLGVLRGYKLLSEAANDPLILYVVDGAQAEIGAALCATYGYTPEDQQAFAAQALRKFQDSTIVDPLERQVRDPLRKLGRNDRLVGPASLALECGALPRNLALGIAAALRYDNPSDPSAIKLQEMLHAEGLDAVFANVCGIDPGGPLANLVRERQPDLVAFTMASRT